MAEPLNDSARKEKPLSKVEKNKLDFQRLLTLNAFQVFLDEVLKHPYPLDGIPPVKIIASHPFVIHPTGPETALFSNDPSLASKVEITFSKKNLPPDQEKKLSSLLGQRTVLSRRMMSLEERIKSMDKNSNPKSLSRKDQADLRSLKSKLETLNQQLTQLDQTILGYFDVSLVTLIQDSFLPQYRNKIDPDLLEYRESDQLDHSSTIYEKYEEERFEEQQGRENRKEEKENQKPHKKPKSEARYTPIKRIKDWAKAAAKLFLVISLASCQADKPESTPTSTIPKPTQPIVTPSTPSPTPLIPTPTPTPTPIPTPTPTPEIVYGPTEEGFEQAKVIDYFTSYQVPVSGILGFPFSHRFLIRAYDKDLGVELSQTNPVSFLVETRIRGGGIMEGEVKVFLPEDYKVEESDGKKFIVFFYKNKYGKTEAIRIEPGRNTFVMMIPSDQGLQPYFVEDFNVGDFEKKWKEIRESQQQPQVSMIFLKSKDGDEILVQAAVLPKVPEFNLYDLLVWNRIIKPNGCSDIQKQQRYEAAIIKTFLSLVENKNDPIAQKKLEVLSGLTQHLGDVKPSPEVIITIRRKAALHLLPDDIPPSQFFAEELAENPKLKELFLGENDTWYAFLIKGTSGGPYQNAYDYLGLILDPETLSSFKNKLNLYLLEQINEYLNLDLYQDGFRFVGFPLE